MIVPESKRKPYAALKLDCEEALVGLHGPHVNVYTMMAVCVKESMGNPWFCRCDSLYKSNLEMVQAKLGKYEAGRYVSLITVKGGRHNAKIPKFRFEQSWHDDYYQHYIDIGLDPLKAFAKCCSYGIAQKGGPFLEQTDSAAVNWQILNGFMWSPGTQLTQLVKDLHSLGAVDGHTLELPLTRYNAGPGAKSVSSYGVKVAALARELWRMYG